MECRGGADHLIKQHLAKQMTTKTVKPGSLFSILDNSGHQIGSVDDWFRFAPPKKGILHWKDGRSAKDLAKAFFVGDAPSVPTELLHLLASSDELGAVQLTQARPEFKIRLDSYRGETRNADLVAVGTGKSGVVAVTVEAKADESFGPTIAEALSAASAQSNVPHRISALSKSILGHQPADVGALRYQLLHGIAATLIFAREQRAAAAVFVVFEIKGPSCLPQNLERNAADLESFMLALSSSAPPTRAGQIVGPFHVPGDERVPSNIPLFIGKAVRLVTL